MKPESATKIGMCQIKMDPVMKKAWLKALRSGKFVQGKGTLRKWNESWEKNQTDLLSSRKIKKVLQHCCLGVYCETVYGIAPQKGQAMLSDYKIAEISLIDDKDYKVFNQIPRKTKYAYWVNRHEASLVNQLAYLNDEQNGPDFNEIADIIERIL